MFFNALTQQQYSPKNCQLLAESQLLLGNNEDFEVAGFKQWLELGRCVQKGQHGTKIFMVVPKKLKSPEGDEEKVSVMKKRTVFFKSQTAPLNGDEAPIISEELPKPHKKIDLSGKLRDLADKLQSQINDKFADRLTNTPKRLAQSESAKVEGYRLERTQKALYALADLHAGGNVPDILQDLTSKKTIYNLMRAELDNVPNGYHSYYIDTGKPAITTPQAVALWGLISHEKDEAAENLRHKINGLQFSNIPNYFPTPQAVIDIMLDHADIYCGMDVLDPSAGHGAIADAVRSIVGIANIETVEINYTLSEILKQKGYKVIFDDFMNVHFGYTFDRIIMNPPFEKGQDIDHICRAFSFLDEMGRLVSVVSAGAFFRSDKKTKEFRDWLQSLTHEVIDLPKNSFKESGANANAKILIIDK